MLSEEEMRAAARKLLRKIIFRERMKGWKKIVDATESEAKQLAMLIDTEGSITISRGGLSLDILVGMSSILPVEMAKKWGGLIYKYKVKSGRWMYQWAFHSLKEVKMFLEKIEPHLIDKKEQAKVALEMFDLLLAKPQNYRKKIKPLAKKLRKLKRIGPPDIDLKEFVRKEKARQQ